ncbi:MAG: anaerobic ribonucleoside-triphosphate reductase activating protein [Spirochaetaceae bacterium]|jgi:anaerobic ribonucleoside-triphosphate reductase activating protein|nr:anaerobic ribonucleoside-triphosphate reductase activating protein [Spirochaetaceae bacterium]
MDQNSIILPEVRISGISEESVVDGPGYRFVIFTQGCPHDCPGCHNPQTHPCEGGSVVTGSHLLGQIRKNPLLRGVTFSGGEPFIQAGNLVPLAKQIRSLGKDIVTYTGYTWEFLNSGSNTENSWRELLTQTDYLVDGPFIEELKSLSIPFRGSANQRIIDVQASLDRDSPVVLETFPGCL